MPRRELTHRQQRFCAEYMIDCNATQAAIRAGYSPGTARNAGPRILRQPAIRAHIEGMMQQMRDDSIASAEEVLRTLTRMLRRELPDHVVVTLRTQASHYDERGKRVAEDTRDQRVLEVPTPLREVYRAAELLGKRYRLCADQADASGGVTLVFRDDYGEDDDATDDTGEGRDAADDTGDRHADDDGVGDRRDAALQCGI